MPMQLDIGAIKAESRSLLRTGSVNPCLLYTSDAADEL